MGRPLTESLLQDVAAAVVTAWSPQVVDIDRPTIDTDLLPYARVNLESVTRLSGSPTQTTYLYNVLITGRFGYPATATDYTGREKLERANDLIDELMTSATLSLVTYGTLQDVPDVTFAELDGDGSRAYEIQARFNIAICGTVRP